MGKLLRRRREKLARKENVRQEKVRYREAAKLFVGQKGRRFAGQFVCDLCRHTRTAGYLFTIDDKEYEVCKFCHDAINDVRPSVKVIYTPMGNGR